MKKHRGNEFWYVALTPIMRLIFRLYYNPKIINKEIIPKKGPVVIACNHKHILDQCLTIMATKRPIHYMAKKEYFDGKFAWFFKMFCCISVDRSKKDENAKKQAQEVLNNDGVLGIFPEGTRNKTKDKILLDFKYGAVSLAQKTNAVIIPCALTGDYKFRSKNLRIKYGDPIIVKENDDVKEKTENLYNSIETLIKDNLKETNRTLKKEIESHGQDKGI